MFSIVSRAHWRAARALPRMSQAPWMAAVRLSSAGLSTAVKARITQTLQAAPVTVFMKGTPDAPQCGFSRAVVQILHVHGIQDFKGVNVLEDEDLRSGIKEFSSWPTIPQVFVKGEFVGGCDILFNMHQSGELAELFAKEGLGVQEPVDAADSAKPDTKPT